MQKSTVLSNLLSCFRQGLHPKIYFQKLKHSFFFTIIPACLARESFHDAALNYSLFILTWLENMKQLKRTKEIAWPLHFHYYSNITLTQMQPNNFSKSNHFVIQYKLLSVSTFPLLFICWTVTEERKREKRKTNKSSTVNNLWCNT